MRSEISYCEQCHNISDKDICDICSNSSRDQSIVCVVEDIRDVKNGKTYIVITLNDGIVYKRVFDKIEEHNMLLLASDNKKYDPYYVHIDEVLELWEFTCSINTQEYDEQELKISSIANMLTQLGVELKELKKSIN